MKARNNTFKGVNMTPSASLDDAISRYGMDFTPKLAPLYYFVDGEKILSPRDMQCYRSDDNRHMGVVGLEYETVPFLEAIEFSRQLGARIVGGVCPNRGERAYLILEADGVVQMGPDDNIVNRFVLTSSHDGTTKIEMRATPFWARPGTAITTDATRPLSFKHTRNVGVKLDRANKVIKVVNSRWNEFSAGVQKMVSVHLSEDKAKEFIESVLPHTGNEASTKLENIRSEILTIYRDTGIATRLPKCRGTLFGLVQAFAEYADIKQTVRESTKRDKVSAALDARLMGAAAAKKQTAWGLALYMANDKRMKGALKR